jgi:hypothetical protein
MIFLFSKELGDRSISRKICKLAEKVRINAAMTKTGMAVFSSPGF